VAYKQKVAVLRISPELHHRLKVLAVKKRMTMQALTEEALRRLLMSEAQKETA